MTPNQAQVLDIIFREFCVSGVTPDYRTIANIMCLKSISGVNRLVYSLIKQGYLEKAGGHRTLEPTRKATNLYGIMAEWSVR